MSRFPEQRFALDHHPQGHCRRRGVRLLVVGNAGALFCLLADSDLFYGEPLC